MNPIPPLVVRLALPLVLDFTIVFGALVVLMSEVAAFLGMDPLSFTLTAFAGTNAVFSVLTFHELFDPVWNYLYLMERVADARRAMAFVEEIEPHNPFRPNVDEDEVLSLEYSVERRAPVFFSSDIMQISPWCRVPQILVDIHNLHGIEHEIVLSKFFNELAQHDQLLDKCDEVRDEVNSLAEDDKSEDWSSTVDTLNGADDIESARWCKSSPSLSLSNDLRDN